MAEKLQRAHVDLDQLRGIEFCWKALGLEGHGVSFMRLMPGEGQPFWHSHEAQEEAYFVLEGEATLRADDQEMVLGRGDAVRVAPEVVRTLGNQGSEPCLILCTGALPAPEGSFRSRVALISDGKRRKDLGVPEWSAG